MTEVYVLCSGGVREADVVAASLSYGMVVDDLGRYDPAEQERMHIETVRLL